MVAIHDSEHRRAATAIAVQAQYDETFSPQMWHPLDICQGNCPHHPLYQPDYDRFMQSQWGDWNEELFAIAHSRETSEETTRRLALEAARDAEAALEAEVIRQRLYARDLEFKQSLGAKKLPRGVAPVRKLIEQPCKWIYAVPGTSGVFSTKPCAECWGHEYTDAKGIYHAPHKCEYIHQNQPEWKAEWNVLALTRDRWRAAKVAAEPNRFNGLQAKPAKKSAKPSGPSGW